MPETYTKEQIDVLKMAVDYYSKRYGDNKPANGLRAILSALSTAERERDALKARCAELEAGWISVEERLPEELRHVLCINARGTPFVAVFINKFFNDEYRLLRDPTHWMPLPEPPAIVGKKEG